MAVMDQMNISDMLTRQAMDTLMKQQGQGGLLGQPQSRLQAGLLGAAQGLAPYMGYTTTPTTFGQAAVAGLTGAAGGMQQQQQQQLQDALTQLQLAGELKPDEVKGESSIGKLYSDYNKGLIPEEVFKEAVKSETGKEYAPTSLQKNVPFLMEIYGINEQQAADLLIDSPEKTIKDLKRTIAQREQVLGEKIGLVVVDYIELILSDKSDATQASAEAAQGLREIANSGKVVVVLLQPNKMSSKADEAPKTYNAAKGSSAIAQAVTSMMGCFRPGYDPEDPTMDKFFGVAILKNRMGPLGTCYFNWHGPTGRITEMEDIERQELDQYLKWKADNKQDIDGGL